MGSTSNGVERRPDSQQLVRQWALLRLLADASEPYGVKQLADQLGVSKATIERDLATLERDFAVIEESVGKQKKAYRIDQKIRALETITFGTTELLAIFAAQASMAGLVGTPIHDDLQSVMLKIRGFLSPRHNGGLDALSRVFVPHARGHVDYEPQRELIDQLVDAIARRRRCVIDYHAAWKGTTRRHEARPLRLVWHRSALYLMGCLGEHERITTLAVHRIKEVEVRPEAFAAPKVDLDGHIHKAFGIFVSDQEEDVEIVFDAEISWRVDERTFHPDERKQRDADGRLHYFVRSSAQWEIIPWVQSFGPLAELVSPASWRESLKANVAAMTARYG
ncbi:MAG: transcriptional regulator [Deltaproteobacteria bacterium]|nr:transcriptional regulator [Deltaproteobacteria bacterium]MDQ3298082.1 transcriptional regulator [Myxococcota bacterium]